MFPELPAGEIQKLVNLVLFVSKKHCNQLITKDIYATIGYIYQYLAPVHLRLYESQVSFVQNTIESQY